MFKYQQCKFKSKYGDFEYYCFNWGEREEDNILCLKSNKVVAVPFVRIQSACFTAEILRSVDCDCHEQLEYSLNLINEQGGYIIYLLKDGRGAGIYQKSMGLRISQEKHIDTAEAYEQMGINLDPRVYNRVIEVLNFFDITQLNLLTNNPRKINQLQDAGIIVDRIPIEIAPTPESLPYLKAKKSKLGHLFSKYL